MTSGPLVQLYSVVSAEFKQLRNFEGLPYINRSTVADRDPNPDPDPSDLYVFWPPGSGFESCSGFESFYHQAKIVRKTWIPTVL